MKPRTEPTAFRTPTAFRAWLENHHADVHELLVRCFKKHAAERGMTYVQALDEALCFGWIDGVRRSVDEDTFSVRFTPRKEKSKWSAVNVARARVLETEGRMRPPGRRAFGERGDGDARTTYSYESRPQALAPAYLRQMAAYRWALAKIYPGRVVEAVLLWTAGPRLMPLSARILDAHSP